jgi:hypothetical protein
VFERRIEFIRADGNLVFIMGLETITSIGDAPGAGLAAGKTIGRRFTLLRFNVACGEQPGAMELQDSAKRASSGTPQPGAGIRASRSRQP